jgi:hypothetical protein
MKRLRSIARSTLLCCIALGSMPGGARYLVAQRPQASTAHASGTFRITGVVVNARDGAPIPFAHLQASPVATGLTAVRDVSRGIRLGGQDARNPGFAGPGPRGAAASELDAATADAHGEFNLTVSHAGGWRLTAQARGFRTQAVDEHDGFSSAVVLTEAAPTYNLTFRLLPSAAVSGIVLDESGDPIERAQVSVELLPVKADEGEARIAPRTVGFAQTDDRGYYEVSGLAPGDYRVRAQATPWYAQNLQIRRQIGNSAGQTAGESLDPSLDFVYPPTWFPSATDENAAETLSLKAGDEVEADLHLTAIPAAHLQVTIPPTPPAAEGQPRQYNPGVIILRVSSAGFDMNSGIFSVNPQNNLGESGALAPGTYQIRLGGSGNNAFGAFGQNDDEDADVRELEIKPGQSGMISMADAVPLLHLKLSLDGTGDAPGLGVVFVDAATGRRITSSPQGRFQRRGRPGPGGDQREDNPPKPESGRTVLLRPGTYEVFLQSATDYLDSISATGAKVTGRTVQIGSEVPSLTLHVKNGRASVAGFARSGGKPLQGAMVELVPATLGQSSAISASYRDQSNSDGSFVMSSVLPGRYILIAIDHGWEIDWQNPAVLAKYLEHGIPLDLQAGTKVSETLEAQLP